MGTLMEFELRNYSLIAQAVLFALMNDRLFFAKRPPRERAWRAALSYLVSFHTSYFLAYLVYGLVSPLLPDDGLVQLVAVTFVCILSIPPMLLAYRRLAGQSLTVVSLLYMLYVTGAYLAMLVAVSNFGRLVLTLLFTAAMLFALRNEIRGLIRIQYDLHSATAMQAIIWMAIVYIVVQTQSPRLVVSILPHERLSSDYEWVISALGILFVLIIIFSTKLFLYAVFRYEEYFRKHERDELTGLYNLSYYLEHGSRWISERVSAGQTVTVIFVNIRGFHDYNRLYGFRAGDVLLRRLGEYLAREFPDSLMARSNADRFVGAVTGDRVSERVQQVHERMHLLQRKTTLELLTGQYVVSDLSQCQDQEYLASRCLDNAQSAMRYLYRHPGGGSGTAVFDERLEREQRLSSYVTDHVEQAAREGWIRAYYQACVSVETGALCQYEALARWADPDHGLLSPGTFVPPLETSGVVHKLDLAVLESACRQIRQVVREGGTPVPISFNLSRTDFEACDIVSQVVALARRYQVAPGLLHAEVTESAMNNDTDIIRQAIDLLHAAGMEVWMDDFGSGYSSLNVLKEYPFDVIKMDMVFMRNFDDRSRSIVRSCTEMIHSLGMRVLVEGVETEDQLAFLREAGVDMAQGYLISKPLPYEEARELRLG